MIYFVLFGMFYLLYFSRIWRIRYTCFHSFSQNILWEFWRYTWYNWNLKSGAQNMKQTIANFFSKLSLPKSLKRHSASRDTNGAMREFRDSSGSETDHHLAIYTEMHSPSTKLWWDKIKNVFWKLSFEFFINLYLPEIYFHSVDNVCIKTMNLPR